MLRGLASGGMLDFGLNLFTENKQNRITELESERWPSSASRIKHDSDKEQKYLKMWSTVFNRLISLPLAY